MRKIRVYIENNFNSDNFAVDFEVTDDTPVEDIGKEAEQIFYDHVSYGWYEIDSEA
jgi:hypothetical protein